MTIVFLSILLLVLGSFANNLITSFSLMKMPDIGRSRCFSCNKILTVIELIPIVSFFLLKGRCNGCGARISFRYPAVEILSLIFGLLIYFNNSNIQEGIISFLMIYILILIGFIDFNSLRIPNSLVAMLLLLGVCKVIINRPDTFETISILSASIGIIGLFSLINYLSEKYLMKQVIGYGDVKLLGVLALCFNLFQTFAIIWFASLTALITYLIFKKSFSIIYEGNRIPFGAFISGSAIIATIYSKDINDILIFMRESIV